MAILPNAQKGKIIRNLLNMQALFLHWFIFSRAPGSNTAASRARERSVALINGRCAAPCAPVLSGGIIANAVTHQSENDLLLREAGGFRGRLHARQIPALEMARDNMAQIFQYDFLLIDKNCCLA